MFELQLDSSSAKWLEHRLDSSLWAFPLDSLSARLSEHRSFSFLVSWSVKRSENPSDRKFELQLDLPSATPLD